MGETLGVRIRHLRENYSLSQKQMAETLSLSNVQLSRYELGSRTPDPDTIVKIAKFFNVSTDFLLGMTPSIKEPTPPYNTSEAHTLYSRIKEVEGLEAFIKSCLESPDLFQTIKEIMSVLKKHA
jgi:transcriptional regulator with XRE-family HTH domain